MIIMVRIHVVIDDDVYKEFLEAVVAKHGKWKGKMKRSIEEALLTWAKIVKESTGRE